MTRPLIFICSVLFCKQTIYGTESFVDVFNFLVERRVPSWPDSAALEALGFYLHQQLTIFKNQQIQTIITMAATSSSQNLLRPSAARPTPSSPQKPGLLSSSSNPRPPLSVHPTATLSEAAYFQGTHPIAIGAGTVIHPRARLLSFDGPIRIGEGCIISEKCVIGGGSASSSSSSSTAQRTQAQTLDASNPNGEREPKQSPPTILENAVVIGPRATVSTGAHIRSAATIDTSAVLGKDVSIGKHAKVCTSCCIPDREVVGDWLVIWGHGAGLQRRKRRNDRGNEVTGGLGGRDVETARLIVLEREREGLTKLVGVGPGARRK